MPLYACFTHDILTLFACFTHAILTLYACFTHAILTCGAIGELAGGIRILSLYAGFTQGLHRRYSGFV